MCMAAWEIGRTWRRRAAAGERSPVRPGLEIARKWTSGAIPHVVFLTFSAVAFGPRDPQGGCVRPSRHDAQRTAKQAPLYVLFGSRILHSCLVSAVFCLIFIPSQNIENSISTFPIHLSHNKLSEKYTLFSLKN
ncbi:hypothetical protein HU200_064789 [Digitaria exilis]|uniref:Uncharacterized protein n=1 Tax=Digitaria exilis TaxID=1010633 RepID=A0A835DYK1_9POAL|nr:hypothetical protein HU200_064789 [Digitaria exilis]